MSFLPLRLHRIGVAEPVLPEKPLPCIVLGARVFPDGAPSDALRDRVLLGVDHDLDEQTRAGLAAGYSDSSLGMGGSHSRATVDSYHLGAYARHDLDQLRLSLGASHSWHRAEVRRDLAYGEVSGRQRARIDARSQQVFAEAAYRLALPAVQLEPFANLAYVNVRTGSFTETGGLTALTGHAGDNGVTFTTLGLHASTDFTVDGVRMFAKETLGWRHAFGDVNPTAALSFADGSNPFSVSGISVQQDAAIMTASLGLKLGASSTLSASYHGQFSSNAIDQGAQASLTVRF